MKTTESQNLLADYAKTGSEPAFRELLTRYIDLVYSTAVRLVGNDVERAKDVTQTVFIDLARKAPSLSHDMMLGGWLHHHTVFVASTLMRGERRRQARERHAVEMNALQDYTKGDLAEVAPFLDKAIDELSVEDRTAILLRFFEQLDFRSVGEALGSTEEAARKRVSRALEKLHSVLQHEGVSLSAAALGTVLATEAVTAAPGALAVSVAGTALAGATAGGTGSTLSLLEFMATTKLKLGVIAVAIGVGIAAPLFLQHQFQSRLREQNQALGRQKQQLAQLAAENRQYSNLLIQAKSSPAISNHPSAEVLRLRGEVARLRREAQEVAQSKAGVSKRADDASGPSEKSTPERLNQLIQWLQRNPSERIPELRLLSAQDWLKAATGSLDKEADYPLAMSQVRSMAEVNGVLPVLQSALKQYGQANAGQFPKDLSQLNPYFKSPIDEAILQRYEIMPASDLGQIIDTSEIGLGSEWVITEKAPANEAFDARLLIGMTNFLLSLQTNRWIVPH